MEKNEEFYSGIETEWQIEEKNEILKNPIETAASILPEMGKKSQILSDQQVHYYSFVIMSH